MTTAAMLFLALYIVLEGAAVSIIAWLDIAQVSIFDPRRRKWGFRALALMLLGFCVVPFIALEGQAEREAVEAAP